MRTEFPGRPVNSRRAFLNRSGAAATALGGAIARTAHAAGDDTIKVALVGCGSRGTGAATQALKTKGPMKLWAMADLFEDRLETSLANLNKGQEADYDREAHGGFAGKIDVPPERRFVGFEAYKQAIDSGVDLVILTATQHFRPEHYEYAVRQGKHVFMEKPVAVDVPGIRRVLAADQVAKQKNLKVGVGLMSRHDVRCQEIIKRIHDGAVGPIRLIRSYWNTTFLRDTPPRRPDEAEMIYQLHNPYHFVWLSGDYFVDALIHAIDTCLWAKGAHPVAAQGQGGRTYRLDRQTGDGFDHHFVEYTFEDESKMFSQTRQISGCWNCGSKFVHGEKGTAWIDRGRIDGAESWRFKGKTANPYQVEHDALIDAIRNDRPYNETEYSAISTMTAILGRMAAYSGQLITWDDAMKSNVALTPEVYALDAVPPVVADETGRYPVAMPGVTKVL